MYVTVHVGLRYFALLLSYDNARKLRLLINIFTRFVRLSRVQDFWLPGYFIN